MLIWVCDIKRVCDVFGKEIILLFYDFVYGFNVGLNLFDFDFKFCSEECLVMVEEVYEKVLVVDLMCD